MDAKLKALLEKLDLSFAEIERRLRTALTPASADGSEAVGGAWVRDVYEDWFIYEDYADSKTYRRSYVIDAETGEVTLGDPTEVIGQMVWMAVGQEAADADLGGDVVPLVEASVRDDGTIPIRIIAPGWGSSGYYPADVLERDGPNVFKAGLHTYWNHPSVSEEKDRPERDLRDLAGTLTKDAYWDANGPAGPGLYGEAQVVGAYRDAVTELAPHIGMSIRAYGKVREGEADGRRGKVISELASAKSVDFVTAAGAGGKILELFESAGREPPAERIDVVTEHEAQALRDENARLTAQVAAFTEAALKARALEVATATLAEADLPAASRVRVAAAQSMAPVLNEDGTLNEDAYREQIRAAAQAELAYVKEIRGSTGAIVGMGRASTPTSAAQLKESFKSMYLRQGKSAEEAERMATVAAQGR